MEKVADALQQKNKNSSLFNRSVLWSMLYAIQIYVKEGKAKGVLQFLWMFNYKHLLQYIHEAKMQRAVKHELMIDN